MSLSFEEAGSQQPYDFRNVGNIGLNIEIKKTDSNTIIFNDTCPNDQTFYIVFHTGKEYKRESTANILPQMLFLNGSEFLVGCEDWLPAYIQEMERLKNTYGRGQGASDLGGIMRVYPRPNFSANISKFLS